MKIKTAKPEVDEVAEVAEVADIAPQAEQAEQPAAEAQQEQQQQPTAETSPADGETKPPESETPAAESAASPPGGEAEQQEYEQEQADYIEAHERELEELKNEFVTAAQRRSDLEADLKAAKKEEKDALKIYNLTLMRGPVKPAAPKATATTPGGQGEAAATSADSPASATPATLDSAGVQSDAWRAASINELTELSEKLREKLAEAGAETIGGLEDLRAKIADHKAEWPKGVGAAKITQIEDAVIAWLTRNRDSYAFQSAQQEQQAQQAGEESAGAAGGSAAPAEATEEWIDTEKWGMMPDAEKQAYLLARYRQLRGDDGNAEWAKPAVEGANYFDDGEAEFWATVATGENHTLQTLLANAACPWHPCDAQDDWLRGFGAAYESWVAEKELPEGDNDTGTELDEPEPAAAAAAVAPKPETASNAPAPAWIDGF